MRLVHKEHSTVADLGGFHWFPWRPPFKNGVNESLIAKLLIYSNRTITLIKKFITKSFMPVDSTLFLGTNRSNEHNSEHNW